MPRLSFEVLPSIIGRVSNVTLCHEVPNLLSHFMTCLSTSGEVSCFVVSL